MRDNELIADFMGVDFKAKDAYLTYPPPICKRFGLYDKSWDWLMPVVEKIGQLDGDYTVSINTQKEPSLYGHECSIYDPGHTVSFVEESKNLINAVHTAVVEFIKWHNGNNI